MKHEYATSIGMTIHGIRLSFRHRHDCIPQRRHLERSNVRGKLNALRWERTHYDGLPELPGICGDTGTLETRHLWGPEGPSVTTCICAKCKEDADDDAA